MKARTANAFTLVELLIVIGIIVLLISILIPVVGRVRLASQETASRAQIQAISGAIDRYYQDFRGYPGPFPNEWLRNSRVTDGVMSLGNSVLVRVPANVNQNEYDMNVGDFTTKLTGAENLVLGLLGGMRWEVYGSGGGGDLFYDPSSVGQGPMSLNPANPKRYPAYIDTKDLSWRVEGGKKTGSFKDEVAAADDTLVPEFVDKFNAGPMPILYLRARNGAKMSGATVTDEDNGVVNKADCPRPPANNAFEYRTQQYDLDAVYGYTNSSIGQGKSVRKSDYTTPADYLKHGLRTVDVDSSSDKQPQPGKTYKFPYDAYPYFANPSLPNSPRNKDGYILISAGRDRVYGTSDDITNFGAVK